MSSLQPQSPQPLNALLTRPCLMLATCACMTFTAVKRFGATGRQSDQWLWQQ
jgi:hypothetical protein